MNVICIRDLQHVLEEAINDSLYIRWSLQTLKTAPTLLLAGKRETLWAQLEQQSDKVSAFQYY